MKKFNFNERRSRKNPIVPLIVVFVVVSLLIATFGFNFLLNTSVFVANKFSKSDVDDLNKSSDIYTNLNIDHIPVATNSAKIVVSGNILNFDTLKFYLNGEETREETVTTTDMFSFEIGELTPGENELYVVASTKNSNETKKTPKYKIMYINTKPKLEINEPQNNSTVSSQEVVLKGLTSKEVLIKVNESPVVVDVNGNFEYLIRLREGENTVFITAQDSAGNTETVELRVNYQKDF